MSKSTTRSPKYINNETVLFLAFELGAKEWKLGFSTGLGQPARQRGIRAGELGKLQQEIAAAKKRFGLGGETAVRSCYEAGRDGFWLHRYLEQAGITNVIVDSSSIEVNRRARRAKTDRLDAAKLLQMLIRYHLGDERVWRVVRVPTREEEDRRLLHREIRTLKKEKTRAINRIKGLLATQGIRLKSPCKPIEEELERMRLWDGTSLPAGLKSRVRREWEQVQFWEGRLRSLESERRAVLRAGQEVDVEKIRQLEQLRAIGRQGAWVLVREFFGWRKFKNRREVGALAGLTPSPYQSGESHQEQGISQAGNRHVRAVAVELAWAWLRYQPHSRLTRWYRRRFEKGGPRARKVGIVAVARRLLIELWRYLETGVLPEGAEFKPVV
jgi:transposase